MRAGSGVIDLPFAHDKAALRKAAARRTAARKAAGRKRPTARERAIDLPFVSQEGPGARQFRNDCGPACVRMALSYLGLAPDVTVDQLQASADPSDDGTTPEDLVKLAKKYGAVATPYYLGPDQVPDGPAIVLVRYSGFSRDSVEGKRYWDVVAANGEIRHWMWWLGNTVVDGKPVTVWNDPLYAVGSGKNVLHTTDEFNAAFLPYFGHRIAITFEGISGAAAPVDTTPLVVLAFDADGVNLRSAPGTSDPQSIIRRMPQGARFTVLESKDAAAVKLSDSGHNFWLRVRADIDGRSRDGYVAAWLVKADAETPPGPQVSAFTWQDVINAALVAADGSGESWQNWLAQAGYWTAFNNALRASPYTGPAIDGWPIAPEYRRKLAQLLALDSAALVAKVVEVTERQDAQQQSRVRGAIVGVHGAPGVGIPGRGEWDGWIQTLQSMGVRWFKQLDDGNPGQRDILDWARALKGGGIEPIIRFYRERQFPDPLPDGYFEKMKLYAAAGITWAEIGNEPNLDYEWQEAWAGRVNFNDPECIRLLAEGWVRDAGRALDAGMRPALYAFAPTDWNNGTHPTLSSIMFSSRLAIYLAERRRAETISLFKRGAWIAVHVANYDKAFDFNPLPAGSPYWDMCLRGYEIIRKCLADTFGSALDLGAIPIMSTEGGVFTPDSTSMTGRPRLSTFEEHARKTVDMFAWLEANSPLSAMCPWCLSADGLGGPFDARFGQDGWFFSADGRLQPRPVVDALRQARSGARDLAAPGDRSDALRRRLREIGIFDTGPTAAPRRKARKPAKRAAAKRKK